jgi:germination protein M
MPRFSPILLTVVLLAACGGGKKAATTPTATPVQESSLRVYFLRDGRIEPVLRVVTPTHGMVAAAIAELGKGPTAQERGLGMRSAVPATRGWKLGRASDGTLSLTTGKLSRRALAEAVYAATQFTGSTTVEVNGTKYTRGSFEALTPPILVELPLPYEQVASPVRLAGSANTFEATFEYELRDSAGRVIAKHFVTATSGSGERGTFDVNVRYASAAVGTGSLTVFERSAANGKRTHQVTIPVVLEQ